MSDAFSSDASASDLSSITLILERLRDADSDDERQAAAADLYWAYHRRVEKIARGRLLPGTGLADEEDVAQSAFRSFFGRIEAGQLDELVSRGHAWSILARLTKSKAIDSVRYDNARRRGGGGSRNPPTISSINTSETRRPTNPGTTSANPSINRLGIGDRPPKAPPADSAVADSAVADSAASDSVAGRPSVSPAATAAESNRRREQVPLEELRDHTQPSGEDLVACKELVDRFLERLSEATLRSIVSMKLSGFTNEEIALKLGCATRTIERKLNLIRRLWAPILETDYGE